MAIINHAIFRTGFCPCGLPWLLAHFHEKIHHINNSIMTRHRNVVPDVVARHSPDWYALAHQQSSVFELLYPLLHCSSRSPQLLAPEWKYSHHWMSPSTLISLSQCTPYPFLVILPTYKDPGTFLHSWEAILPIQKQGCRTKIKSLCHFLYYSISNCCHRMPRYPSLPKVDWNRRRSEQKSAKASYFSTFLETPVFFALHSPLFLNLEKLSLPSRRMRNIWPYPSSSNPRGTSPITSI